MAERIGATSMYEDNVDDLKLFDDAHCSRKEIINRFLTPISGREGLKPTKERIFNVSGMETCFINPRSSFIAPQIRDEYDPARIQRLGVNIRDSENGQLQNCAVAFVDEVHIEGYLDDLNRYFESSVATNDLVWHDGFESYLITVFGHNRQLAIASANLEVSGNPDRGILMRANVFRNPSFWRVIEAQAVENTGDNPPLWDRARAIVMYRELRQKDGTPASQVEVAEKLNVDPGQIWRAERYEALPKEIKELVTQQKLPYSGAFELDVLLKDYGEDYVVDLARDLADKKSSGPQIMDAIKRRRAALSLTPEARLLIEDGALGAADAKAIADVADILSADEINRLVSWIALGRVSHKEVKAELHKITRSKLSGEVDMFSDVTAFDDSQLVAVRERNSALNEANMRARVQDSLRAVTETLIGLKAATNAGLLSDAADRLIPTTAPEQLLDNLQEWIDQSDISELSPNLLAEKIRTILGSVNGPQIIDEVLVTLSDVAAENSQTQARRRHQLGSIAAGVSSRQDSLFL